MPKNRLLAAAAASVVLISILACSPLVEPDIVTAHLAFSSLNAETHATTEAICTCFQPESFDSCVRRKEPYTSKMHTACVAEVTECFTDEAIDYYACEEDAFSTYHSCIDDCSGATKERECLRDRKAARKACQEDVDATFVNAYLSCLKKDSYTCASDESPLFASNSGIMDMLEGGARSTHKLEFDENRGIQKRSSCRAAQYIGSYLSHTPCGYLFIEKIDERFARVSIWNLAIAEKWEAKVIYTKQGDKITTRPACDMDRWEEKWFTLTLYEDGQGIVAKQASGGATYLKKRKRPWGTAKLRYCF